jgi:hypothetical protein
MTQYLGEIPWPEFPHLTRTRIEQSRQDLNVPPEWAVELCANRCGEVVFVPPEVPSTTGMLPTCSLACVEAIVRSRS